MPADYRSDAVSGQQRASALIIHMLLTRTADAVRPRRTAQDLGAVPGRVSVSIHGMRTFDAEMVPVSRAG